MLVQCKIKGHENRRVPHGPSLCKSGLALSLASSCAVCVRGLVSATARVPITTARAHQLASGTHRPPRSSQGTWLSHLIRFVVAEVVAPAAVAIARVARRRVPDGPHEVVAAPLPVIPARCSPQG